MTRFIYPASVDDHPGILAFAEAIEDASPSYRREIEYSGVGNTLYYLGKQWQTFMPDSWRWRPLQYHDKPTVNRFAPLVNTLQSLLVRFTVPITYTAATDEPADVAAAAVADRVESLVEKETNAKGWAPDAAMGLILTGNAFLISGYEFNARHGMRPIQMLQCVGDEAGPGCGATWNPRDPMMMQGVCPNCQGRGLVPAVRNGQPIMGQTAKGKHTTEVKSALHTYFNSRASRFEHSDYFMVEDRVPRGWVERVYGAEALDNVAGLEGQTNWTWADQLSTATGSYGLGLVGSSDDDSVRMRRLWLDPYPGRAEEGIYAVLLGETVMESIPYPYRDAAGVPSKAIVHIPFDRVPGRLLAKTRCDDLRPLQDQLNTIEAYLQLHTKRMAGGKLLLPRGLGIGRIVGETGQVLTYDAMPGVPAPQFVPGMTVPSYFFNWKQDVLAAMDAVMGTFEVMRGEAPKGVSAYAAIQYLDEQGTQAQSALQDNWAMGKLEWARQQLCIFREYADEPRILSLGVGRWSAKKFSNADLQGGVDLDAEIGISRPRTQVAKRAVVDQFVRLGGVNLADPYEKLQIAKALGATELMPNYKADEERAARENDRFLGPPDPTMPPLPPDVSPALQGFPLPMPWHNHPVDIMQHKALLDSERGENLPPLNREALIEHMMIHQREIAMAQERASLGPGQVVPGPGNTNGKNRGTAKEGGGGTDQEQMDREGQMASPDSFTGAA